MAVKTTDSVGLRGAKRIGDSRVSSLAHFSWSTRHDSTVSGAHKSRAPSNVRSAAHDQSTVSKAGRQKKG
jgi:hypothetical protein